MKRSKVQNSLKFCLVQLDSCGDVSTCSAGTTSQTYRDSIVQRMNWYRRMAGLDTVAERASYTSAT